MFRRWQTTGDADDEAEWVADSWQRSERCWYQALFGSIKTISFDLERLSQVVGHCLCIDVAYFGGPRVHVAGQNYELSIVCEHEELDAR